MVKVTIKSFNSNILVSAFKSPYWSVVCALKVCALYYTCCDNGGVHKPNQKRMRMRNYKLMKNPPAETRTTAVKRLISSSLRPRLMSFSLKSNMELRRSPAPMALRVSTLYFFPPRKVTVRSFTSKREAKRTTNTCKARLCQSGHHCSDTLALYESWEISMAHSLGKFSVPQRCQPSAGWPGRAGTGLWSLGSSWQTPPPPWQLGWSCGKTPPTPHGQTSEGPHGETCSSDTPESKEEEKKHSSVFLREHT